MLGCSHRSELKRCVNNFRRKTFFRLWHQFENAYHIGTGPLRDNCEVAAVYVTFITSVMPLGLRETDYEQLKFCTTEQERQNS